MKDFIRVCLLIGGCIFILLCADAYSFEGYLYDRDANGAFARLRPLDEADVFDYIQRLTERFISQSNVPAITPMVALAEAIGRLTPAMEIYRSTPVPTPGFGN